MPDWKRLIIGDAVALDSRDKNFYRDMFLFAPFLLFGIMAVSGLFRADRDYLGVVKCGLLCLSALALIKERLVLVAAALGFVCLQSSVSYALKHNPIALAVSIPAGVACFLLIRSLKDYKPSYSFEKGVTIATLLVIAAGGICSYAIFRLLFVVP